MSDKIYKTVRVVGCSSEGFEKAIESAVETAAKSLRGLSWFEVVEYRGAVKDGKVADWQVTVDVSFKLEAE